MLKHVLSDQVVLIATQGSERSIAEGKMRVRIKSGGQSQRGGTELALEAVLAT